MGQKANISLITIFIVLALVGGFILGYLYGQKRETNSGNAEYQTKEAEISTGDQNLDDNYPYGINYQILAGCTAKECLFKSPSQDGTVEGYAVLEGYIHTYQADNYGTRLTCDSLLVTGGNKILIDSFKTEIKNGNGLNKIDKNGNLLINIELDDLDTNIKSIIKSSSASNKILLGVIRTTPQPIGVSTCTNLVDIVHAKPLSR